MKTLKKLLSIVLCACLLFCIVGCGDEYDNFDPVGVRVVESIGGSQYETVIDDAKTAKKMWKVFDPLYIDDTARAEMGTAYIYMCFYNEDQSTLGIFTMYENGACCLGEDFKTFYTVDDGENVYLELCDLYTEYETNKKDNESK